MHEGSTVVSETIRNDMREFESEFDAKEKQKKFVLTTKRYAIVLIRLACTVRVV